MHILHVRTLGDKKQYFFFLQEIVFNFLLGDPTGVDEIAYSFKLEACFFFQQWKNILFPVKYRLNYLEWLPRAW